PQLLAAGAVGLGAGDQRLTEQDLAPLVQEATRRWVAAGVNTARLNGVRFVVADLPDGMLGLTTNGLIQIDLNAAGMGWFIDPTPASDAEFSLKGSNGAALATAGSPA